MKQENTSLFNQLLLWQKFLLLGLIILILVALPFGFYFNALQQDIAVAQNEINGIKPSIEPAKNTAIDSAASRSIVCFSGR